MLKVLAAATESFSQGQVFFCSSARQAHSSGSWLGVCFHLHPVHDQALVSVIKSSIRLLSVYIPRCSIAERLSSATAIVEFLY